MQWVECKVVSACVCVLIVVQVEVDECFVNEKPVLHETLIVVEVVFVKVGQRPDILVVMHKNNCQKKFIDVPNQLQKRERQIHESQKRVNAVIVLDLLAIFQIVVVISVKQQLVFDVLWISEQTQFSLNEHGLVNLSIIFNNIDDFIKDKLWHLKSNGVLNIKDNRRNVSQLHRNISFVVRYLKEQGRPIWPSFEEFGVVADLPELHDQVHEIIDFCLGLKHLEELLKGKFAFDGVVEALLSFGHFTDDL